jgi:hypothetical protein
MDHLLLLAGLLPLELHLHRDFLVVVTNWGQGLVDLPGEGLPALLVVPGLDLFLAIGLLPQLGLHLPQLY